MGHVTANHGLQRQQQEAEEVLATKVVTDVLGESPTAKAALIRGKLRLAQFSRNQELEADAIGIKSIGEAGFDPYAAGRFLQSMSAYTDFRSVSGATDASLDFLASTPTRRSASNWRSGMPASSARRALARATAIPSSPASTACSTATRRRKAMCAATPSCIRASASRSPCRPASSSTIQAAAVTATGPGDMAIRFDGVSIDKNRPLTDYIRSGWVAGLDDASVQQETINGNEAATAHAGADGWQFDIAVIRAGGQVYRLLTAAPSASTTLDRGGALGERRFRSSARPRRRR